MTLKENVAETVDFLRERIGADFTPDIALVLGTGFGQVAEVVEDPIGIHYAEVPHMVPCTAQLHTGEFIFGTIAGKRVVVANGRYHAYEGFTAQEVAFSVWVANALGATTLITTNTVGAINKAYQVGDYCVMSDHINFMGMNPISGREAPEMGRRYFTMEQIFDADLRCIAHECGQRVGVTVVEGVYLGLLGPTFESPAEVRALRMLGADTVAMSSIEEVIAARQMRMRVLGVSLVSDLSYDGTGDIPDPAQISIVMRESGPRSAKLLQAIVAAL